MSGLYCGPRVLAQAVGKVAGWGYKQEVIKHSARTCFTQSTNSSSSMVLEHSMVKFDRLLDRTTIYHLDQFSAKSPTPVTIKWMLEEASQPTQEQSFKYITKEIPIRLANMIMELQLMPRALSIQPQFQEIVFQYIQSFKDLLEFSIATFNPDTNDRLVAILKEIRLRHINTVPVMAAAIQKMMADNLEGKIVQKNIQYCLNRLFLNRISIHLLISLYKAVNSSHKHQVSQLININDTPNNSMMIGAIDPNCDIISIAREAYDDAAIMCDREYQYHPELEIEGRNITNRNMKVKEVRMSYLPNHLHLIFFEIFKNAMKATVEHSRKKERSELPSVKCLVSKSKGDISIRVSDLGGGISRNMVDNMFEYHFTSTGNEDGNFVLPGSGRLESQTHPMHGLGYGLPLSRLYARYIQGDLNIVSMHGLGSDVYIYLKALSDETKECLPTYSIQTADMYVDCRL